MVTFRPEDGAEPPVGEQARISTEGEKGTDSPTVEEMLSALEDDDLTGLLETA